MTQLIQTNTPLVGNRVNAGRAKRTYQATVVGTGAVAASVDIEVSNNGTDFLLLGSISPTGTTRATDGFTSDAPWAFARANVTSISGTEATVTVVTEA